MCFEQAVEVDVRYYEAVGLMKEFFWRCIMIKITDTAKEKLDVFLAENPGKYLRVIIKGIG